MKMNIIVSGIHLEVTEAIKAHAAKKAEKLAKYFDSIIEVKMNLSVEHTKSEGERQIADVIVFANGTTLKAYAVDKNLYTAIDDAVEMLEAQVKKYKERLKNRNHHQKPAKEVVFESAITHEVVDKAAAVSKYKLIEQKPMSVEEAVLQMNLLKKSFYAFMNMETEELNVVYQTRKGGIGLIEPAWD